MKKLFLISFVVLLSSHFCIAQEEINKRLPEPIQRYMKTYLPHQKVVKYKSEITMETGKYKVFIDNGITIFFDEDFQPYLIFGNVNLPEAVIPNKVHQYVKENFPNHQIYRWQKRAINQTIQLDDGTNIKFDSEGNFVRMRKG